MSREFRSLSAALLLTLAGFLIVRQIVAPDAVAADWPLPLLLALAGLVTALWPERASATLSPVPAADAGLAQTPGDDLTLIKGIGPQRAHALAQAGCPRFDDLARLSESELARLLEAVGAVVPSAAALRSWISQAQIAATGNMAWLREVQEQMTPAGEESA